MCRNVVICHSNRFQQEHATCVTEPPPFRPSGVHSLINSVDFYINITLLRLPIVTLGHSGTEISVYATGNYVNTHIALDLHRNAFPKRHRNQCAFESEVGRDR